MNKLTLLFSLFTLLVLVGCTNPLELPPHHNGVLVCAKDCGTYDANDEFTFQARLAGGANVTFIEDDIILSSAHILGFHPSKKNYSCGKRYIRASKRDTDWSWDIKSIYVVDGKNYPNKKIIIAKVLDISARATSRPPGYDIVVAHVDRNCKECSKDVNIKITPIAIANNLPLMDTKALHIAVPGNSQMNKGRFYVDHLLNGRIWGAQNTSCSRQTIKHDGKLNPPMLFDTSGSPVIYKECGKYVLHGLHGNGMDYKGYMYEFLQLLQTQKEWIQSEIYRWTGRTEMLDSCSPTGTRSFMPGNEFDVPQNGCNREQQKALYFEIYAGNRGPRSFPSCRISHSIWDSIWTIKFPLLQ